MLRRTVVTLPSCCVLAALLSGCVMARTYRDHPLDEPKIASIQRGITTKAEVLERLGPPQEIDPREIASINLSADPFEPPPERIVAARYFRYTFERGNGMVLLIGHGAQHGGRPLVGTMLEHGRRPPLLHYLPPFLTRI